MHDQTKILYNEHINKQEEKYQIFVYFNSTQLTFTERVLKLKYEACTWQKNCNFNHNRTSHE